MNHVTSPAGWLLRTGISSGTLCSVIEYGLPLPFFNLPCKPVLHHKKALPQTVQVTPQLVGLSTVTEEGWILLSPPVSGDRCMPDPDESNQQRDHTAPGSNPSCASPCTACNLQKEAIHQRWPQNMKFLLTLSTSVKTVRNKKVLSHLYRNY